MPLPSSGLASHGHKDREAGGLSAAERADFGADDQKGSCGDGTDAWIGAQDRERAGTTRAGGSRSWPGWRRSGAGPATGSPCTAAGGPCRRIRRPHGRGRSTHGRPVRAVPRAAKSATSGTHVRRWRNSGFPRRSGARRRAGLWRCRSRCYRHPSSLSSACHAGLSPLRTCSGPRRRRWPITH